jgi:rubrerythrin
MATNENLIKIFEYALNQEHTGKSFFESQMERLKTGAAESALRKLVNEEEKHIRFINGILENLRSSGQVAEGQLSVPQFDQSNFFDERAREEFLDQCVEGSMVPDVTVFNTAWLIEKDLSEYYESMAQQTDGMAQEAFRMLAEWEKTHEQFFRRFRDKLSETYSQMPWGG